jgi:hypothetical protein
VDGGGPDWHVRRFLPLPPQPGCSGLQVKDADTERVIIAELSIQIILRSWPREERDTEGDGRGGGFSSLVLCHRHHQQRP